MIIKCTKINNFERKKLSLTLNSFQFNTGSSNILISIFSVFWNVRSRWITPWITTLVILITSSVVSGIITTSEVTVSTSFVVLTNIIVRFTRHFATEISAAVFKFSRLSGLNWLVLRSKHLNNDVVSLSNCPLTTRPVKSDCKLFITCTVYKNERSSIVWDMFPGADPGGGGGPRRAPPPPKIGKNMIFWRKIVISHTKYPKNFRASHRSAQFF